jgi:hypothetical protein
MEGNVRPPGENEVDDVPPLVHVNDPAPVVVCQNGLASLRIAEPSPSVNGEKEPRTGVSEGGRGDDCPDPAIRFVSYESELQMPDIMSLIQKDLSEPYSIYTYRYFIHNWPKLCFLAMDGSRCVGAIVCKLDLHKHYVNRGYIAMLVRTKNFVRLMLIFCFKGLITWTIDAKIGVFGCPPTIVKSQPQLLLT